MYTKFGWNFSRCSRVMLEHIHTHTHIIHLYIQLYRYYIYIHMCTKFGWNCSRHSRVMLEHTYTHTHNPFIYIYIYIYIPDPFLYTFILAPAKQSLNSFSGSCNGNNWATGDCTFKASPPLRVNETTTCSTVYKLFIYSWNAWTKDFLRASKELCLICEVQLEYVCIWPVSKVKSSLTDLQPISKSSRPRPISV
jgi:hypothetical protein